jgi:putative transposase
MVTLATRREALEILTNRGLSQRSACLIAGVSRRIGSYELRQPDKDRVIAAQLIEASGRYLRFGYRRIAVMKIRVWAVYGDYGAGWD